MTIDCFEDINRVFAHEAGHAVVAWALPSVPTPTSIHFYPLQGEAQCGLTGWPKPACYEEYLAFTSVFLGGFAGESVMLGDFLRFLRHDFECALEIAKLVRRIGNLPRRRAGITPFRARLPWALHAGIKEFLNQAFDLAVRTLEAHRETHQRVYGQLSRGYCIDGKVEFPEDELASWLGPRPHAR